jgi:hypothetical protein
MRSSQSANNFANRTPKAQFLEYIVYVLDDKTTSSMTLQEKEVWFQQHRQVFYQALMYPVESSRPATPYSLPLTRAQLSINRDLVVRRLISMERRQELLSLYRSHIRHIMALSAQKIDALEQGAPQRDSDSIATGSESQMQLPGLDAPNAAPARDKH